MTLRAADMNRLWADSSPMHTSTHGRWLSEALQCLRTTGEPAAAVGLLQALRPYNERDAERRALDDVMRWIERRLRAQPSATAERLMLELGWLRRMAVVRASAHRGSSTPGGQRHGGGLERRRR